MLHFSFKVHYLTYSHIFWYNHIPIYIKYIKVLYGAPYIKIILNKLSKTCYNSYKDDTFVEVIFLCVGKR